MRKIDRSKGKEQTGARQRYLPLSEFAREALWDTVMLSGLAFVEEALEAERSGLCGPRYAHDAGRAALRAGHVASSLTLGGRRAEVKRPRVRSMAGQELSCRVGNNGVRAIRSRSGRSNRWCWESRAGAMRVRWSRCHKSLGFMG